MLIILYIDEILLSLYKYYIIKYYIILLNIILLNIHLIGNMK